MNNPLVWSPAPPKVPGWYFFRETYADKDMSPWICPVEVVTGEDKRVQTDSLDLDPGIGKLWVIDRYIWSGTGDTVAMLEWIGDGSVCEWAGPIPMPRDTEMTQENFEKVREDAESYDSEKQANKMTRTNETP